jgi:hypothetical protein
MYNKIKFQNMNSKINNMKKIILSILFVFVSISSAMTVSAQGANCQDSIFPELIVCGRSQSTACAKERPETTQPCNLGHVLPIFSNVILFAITLVLILIPLYIMWIGIQIIINRGIPEELVKLKKQILASIGYLILIFAAWLIISEVTKVFKVSSDVPSFLLDNGGTRVDNPGSPIR